MKTVSRILGSHIVLNNSKRLTHQLSSEKHSKTSQFSAKEKHPYKKIHPWKSGNEFSEYLVNNLIYNKDGLVALNKPYGIALRPRGEKDTKPRYTKDSPNQIVNKVDYSITDSLPSIAKQLGYKKLTVVRGPERYMSGVTLLAADETAEKAIIKCHNRGNALNKWPKIYWIITTRIPSETSGSGDLGIKLHRSPCQKFERPVIMDKWFNAQVKRGDVQRLFFEYKVLSNSKQDLCSLVELRSSTTKWHAVRLFAATKMYSPILGDNIHGSRVQNIMGKWMRVNPFLDSVSRPPELDENLLKQLELSAFMQLIIPAHIHLRRFELTWYFGRKKDLIIEAPLSPEFSWTINTLGFELPVETNCNSDEEKEEELQLVQNC